MAASETTLGRPARYLHWPQTTLRVGFGVIWLIDAVLKWLPGFRSNYASVIKGLADGQPGWTKPWFHFWINLQLPAVGVFAYLVAVIETLIALALIFGFARKLTCVGAIVFSLLIWSTAEGFGGPYTSGASDVGTSLIYALVFAALLTFSYGHGVAPLTLDAWLERRISWWHWVAEVGNHHAQDPNPLPFSRGAAGVDTPIPAMAAAPRV